MAKSKSTKQGRVVGQKDLHTSRAVESKANVRNIFVPILAVVILVVARQLIPKLFNWQSTSPLGAGRLGADPSVPTNVSYQLTWNEERPVEIEGSSYVGVERIGKIWMPFRSWPSEVRILADMLTPTEVKSILKLHKSFQFITNPDSVDGRPSFQFYAMRFMQFQDDKAAKVLQPIFKSRIEPFVRSAYSCPDCVVCTALLRRYLPHERKGHGRHFGMEAYVTAVVDLNPSDHVGGLFADPRNLQEERSDLASIVRSGDVLFHQYDLNHGVEVKEGSRFSLILWFKDSAASCTGKVSPWYKPDAEAGDIHAQFNHASLLRDGRGAPRDIASALFWFEKAGSGSHPGAQMFAGHIHAQGGPGVAVNETASALWLLQYALNGNNEESHVRHMANQTKAPIAKPASMALSWLSAKRKEATEL